MFATHDYRRAVAFLLVFCIAQITARAQSTETSATIEYAGVVTDAKGNSKSIVVDFAISTPHVVDQVNLFYKAVGTDGYKKLRLKLNPQLLYEGSIPFSGKIEYYLTVMTEKGIYLPVGSDSTPLILPAEDLPRVPLLLQSKHRWLGITVITILVAIVGAIFGPGRKKN